MEAPGTLHGCITRGFPNLFFAGSLQAGVTANFMSVLDEASIHVAYIVSKAAASQKSGDKVIIEPSAEAENEWAMRVMPMATATAAMIGCTPSYLNREGAIDKMLELPVEKQMEAARVSVWGKGYLDFVSVLKQWRAEGSLSGLEVRIAA